MALVDNIRRNGDHLATLIRPGDIVQGIGATMFAIVKATSFITVTPLDNRVRITATVMNPPDQFGRTINLIVYPTEYVKTYTLTTCMDDHADGFPTYHGEIEGGMEGLI